MLERSILKSLIEWKKSAIRKPLILKGARQVGKSFIVKELAKEFTNFIEINFEEDIQATDFFNNGLSPKTIIQNIELHKEIKIIPGETLLFFDEIQFSENALKSLRYFYENMPSLHIIATGSLLEFELEKIGVPVGRVEFLHLYPLSFKEYLINLNNGFLLNEVTNNYAIDSIPDALHIKLLDEFKKYIVIGGLPEVLNRYFQTNDYLECKKIHSQLVYSYRLDFNKYAKKFQLPYLEKTFTMLPRELGKKIKYSNIDKEVRSQYISESINLLEKSSLIKKIYHSSSNGIPLLAEAKITDFKASFIDIGLVLRILGLNFNEILNNADFDFVNKGGLAEQFIAQELISYTDPREEPQLYYWRRESKSGNAEVDFIKEYKDKVIPIEVKAGSTGTLKSLKLFLDEKINSKIGIRFYAGKFDHTDPKIISLPLYATFLLDNVLEKIYE